MEQPAKKSIGIKILIGVAAILAIGAVGFMVWRNDESSRENQKPKEESAKIKSTDDASSKVDKPAPSPTPAPAPFKPSADMIENITAILSTVNTQPFEGYVADEVTLYYESAKPAATLKDKTQIAGTLQYFDDAKTPWDLNLSQTTIDHYKSKFPSLFGDDCLAGHSADAGHVVSFCFTQEGKIHSIFFCRDPRIFN